VWILLV
jgi:outer membrane immunogenic protein